MMDGAGPPDDQGFDDGAPPEGDAFSTGGVRVPPHNFEIEMALLASLMANNRAFEGIAGTTRAEHFADPTHARIFETIATLIEEGRQANAVTMNAYLAQDAEFQKLGGGKYLARLQAAAMTIVNTKDYARQLRDLWQRREMIGLAQDLEGAAYQFEIGTTADQQIEGLEKALYDLVERGEAGTGPVDLGKAVSMALERADRAGKGVFTGLRTGLADLDERLGGLEPGTLTVVGARPSMGKTALAVAMARHAAANGTGVLFFSLEMDAAQIGRRAVCQISGIPLEAVRNGRLGQDAWVKLTEAQGRFAKTPFIIDDRPGASLMQISAAARRAKRKNRIGLIVVDHLGLMATARGLEGQPVQAIGHNTRGLKRLAKELGLPILLLCQLSRANELREEKRPQLSDLRGSGDIEQDTDVVLFVHREHYYLTRAEPVRSPKETEATFLDKQLRWNDACREAQGKAELLIAKNRDGAVGMVRVGFDGPTANFHDLDAGGDA